MNRDNQTLPSSDTAGTQTLPTAINRNLDFVRQDEQLVADLDLTIRLLDP